MTVQIQTQIHEISTDPPDPKTGFEYFLQFLICVYVFGLQLLPFWIDFLNFFL